MKSYFEVIPEKRLPEVYEAAQGELRESVLLDAVNEPMDSLVKDPIDKAKWWIEGDVLFGWYEKLTGGLLCTQTIFRNPDGMKEQMNQYFFVNHARIIYYFSRAD